MSGQHTIHVPVLVAGAGAGGLSTSALLARHGVSSLVVERRREVFRYPKARNLSFRSLEILRALGVGDAVHAVADGASGMVVKPTLNSAEERPALDLGTIFAGLDRLSPEPTVQYCPQSRLEPILLNYLRGHSSQAWYGTDLLSVEQDDGGVTAVLRGGDSASDTQVRAEYLVAADGVHSHLRDALGVTTSGHGALPIYVIFVYFRAPWRALVPDLGDGSAVQVRNDAVDGIFVAADGDLGMFITTYLPDEGQSAVQFSEQRCRELIIAAAGEEIDVDVIEVVPWQPYEQVADQFRAGRVFFVGDSAHAMPPLKAGGANVAIQSADNLAWKIAAVLQGWAGPGLLDTYHTERHPIGAFSARQSLTGPTLKLLRRGRAGPELAPDEEQPMFAVLAGYQYRSAAVIIDDAAPTDDAHLVQELRGQPGTRVPHAWVTHRARRVSTLDLLGSGFTLLVRERGDAWAAAAAAVRAPIIVHAIGARGDVVDVEGRWADATALGPQGALLVRPDGFVAWRCEALPAEADRRLSQAMSAILSQPTPGNWAAQQGETPVRC